jgi:hypothetical protein
LSIPVWDQITGNVFIRNFDQGIMDTLGATADPNAFNIVNGQKIPDPCYKLDVNGQEVSVYFSQPEPVFQKKLFPFITVNRDDMSPAMSRWHGPGQLEHKVGVSGVVVLPNGTSGYAASSMKYQAYPYDITYTISVWDRYEVTAQTILSKVLRALPPIGRILVKDSLNLLRTYEYYSEGGIANLQEVIDPVTRARGYAITLRIEAELDLLESITGNAVTGLDLSLHVKKDS